MAVLEEDRDLSLTLAYLEAPKIRTLQLIMHPLNFGEAILNRIPSIEELVFGGVRDTSQDDEMLIDELWALSPLKLRTLRFAGSFSIESIDTFIMLLNGLPELKELDTNGTTNPMLIFLLRCYLANSGRGLILNSSKFVRIRNDF